MISASALISDPAVSAVSVVIPCHNPREDYLRECIQSVLTQTFPHWEAFVVDDGSSQGDVAGVVSEFGDPRLQVIRHPANRGLGAARNTGLRTASTNLIAYLDSDDRFAPEFVELTQRALQDHPSADWVLTDWQITGAVNDLWPFPDPLPPPCPAHLYFVGSGTLMRKKAWEAVGGYSEDEELRGAEDWDFWIGAVERGLHPVHIAKPLYIYRKHAKAMSLTTSLYNSHMNRAAMYARHRRAFHSLGLNCPHCRSPKRRLKTFFAQGFLTSSIVSLNRGEWGRAIPLAFRAFALQPTDPRICVQLMRSILPRPARAFLGRIKRAARRGSVLDPQSD